MDGEISGLRALIKFKKNSIVGCVPLDDSIQATGTPLPMTKNDKLQESNQIIYHGPNYPAPLV
jgi:hypothetical protein